MSIRLVNEELEIEPLEGAAPSVAHGVWSRLCRHPMGAASIIVLTVIVLFAIIYPWVSHYTYLTSTGDYRQSPSAKHWLGTDDGGYDILTLLAYGARISLFVGVGVEAIVLLIGGTVGLLAGYYGRATDTLLMRLTDMVFAFPDILLAILIMATRGRSLGNLFLALTITGWPGLARLVRGQALSLRRLDYVEAARALGLPNGQIIRRHLLPNLLSPIIVASTIDIAGVIIAEATLSFLGIGVPRPLASWGSMISGPLQSQFYRSEPIVVIAPAAALGLTVLALNFLGDALRDALDPRARTNSS